MPILSATADPNRWLSCPACGASEFESADASITCSRCGARHVVTDGIVDFVGGRLESSLDAIDYDAYYGVDAPKIAKAFDLVLEHAGAIIARPMQSVLELGAGTGLLTAGLVERASTNRLLVTDISPKMLRLCRDRLRSLAHDRDVDIRFATNDGVALGARRGAFDLAFGYFVVHHILEWQKTLAAVFDATNERGMAVFVEPNRRFHLALTLVMNRVLERLLPEMPDLPGSDLSSLLNLNTEWNFTLKYADLPSVLSRQEDKHFFDRAAFERAARDAGWGYTRTLRFDPRTTSLETAKVYASQLKLSRSGAARFIDVFASELPGPFALLEDVDSSPSYVFVMAKRSEDAALFADLEVMHREPGPALAEPPSGDAIVYDLDIALAGDPSHLAVTGWIAATRPVIRVRFLSGDLAASALVGERRVDVVRGMSRLRRHPFANLLYSGIRGMEAGPSDTPRFDPSKPLSVVAELDDGRHVTLRDGLRFDRNQDRAFGTRISVLD